LRSTKGAIMAKRKKASKVLRRGTAAKRGKSRKVAKAAKAPKRPVARAKPKRAPAKKVVAEVIEQPAPGVTEVEENTGK
jgi:hypothetical protein